MAERKLAAAQDARGAAVAFGILVDKAGVLEREARAHIKEGDVGLEAAQARLIAERVRMLLAALGLDVENPPVRRLARLCLLGSGPEPELVSTVRLHAASRLRILESSPPQR
jgi:hypothetical protein